MASNINIQLERAQSIHRMRLVLRQLAATASNWMIPATLWAFVFYFDAWNTDEGTSQFTTTLILIPPLALAGLILVKRQWLQENLADWFGAKLMARLDAMNQSVSNQIGAVLLVAVALTFIGLPGLVTFMAWVMLIGFVAQLVPSVQKWLQENPDLRRPPTQDDLAREMAEFKADRGESLVEPVSAPAPSPHAAAASPVSTGDGSPAPTELPNPELVEARHKLAAATDAFSAAEKAVVPDDESAEDRKKRLGHIAKLRRAMNSCRDKVTQLENAGQ